LETEHLVVLPETWVLAKLWEGRVGSSRKQSWIYTFTRKPAVTKPPSIPFETLFQIYDCAVKFRQSCQWLANHLWVY